MIAKALSTTQKILDISPSYVWYLENTHLMELKTTLAHAETALI